jgi:radical SAM superfamily enzyme YgiQ (UPF0313 family)
MHTAPRILFVSPCKPYPKAPLEKDPYDFFYYRNTLGQKGFMLRSLQSWHSLHLLAQNLPVESVVLENPTMSAFSVELTKTNYDFVAIGFTALATGNVLAMAKQVKKMHPGCKVVLGGYGTCVFKDPDAEACELRTLADYICDGEGIAYLRELLFRQWGIPSAKAATQELVPARSFLFRSAMPLFDQLVVVSALGCSNNCSFCSTSAYFKGRVIRLATAFELYTVLKSQAVKYPKIQSAIIYEEDFLQDKKRTLEFISLIGKDPLFSERPLYLTVFSSARSVESYDIFELLACNIGTIFIGVESFEKDILNCGKLNKRDADIESLFRELHRHGIATLGSMILGWDGHTKENIDREIDRFIALNPTFYQVVPLHPIAGTALWSKFKSEERIDPAYTFSRDVIYEPNFSPANFTKNEILELVSRTYRGLVRQGGPWPFRMFENLIQGFDAMSKMPGVLYDKRKLAYKKLLMQIAPFATAAGLLFWGKPFRQKWKLAMIRYVSLFPLEGGIALVAGAAVAPMLFAWYHIARLLYKLNPNGDQPPTKRYTYNK